MLRHKLSLLILVQMSRLWEPAHLWPEKKNGLQLWEKAWGRVPGAPGGLLTMAYRPPSPGTGSFSFGLSFTSEWCATKCASALFAPEEKGGTSVDPPKKKKALPSTWPGAGGGSIAPTSRANRTITSSQGSPLPVNKL